MHRALPAAIALALTTAALAACDPPWHYDAPSTGDVPPIPSATSSSRPLRGPSPALSPVVTAATPPPPISGGTLAVMHDGRIVAADPDRDAVFVVTPETNEVRAVRLERGEEPGRVVEDLRGRVHVALRRAGKVATIDPGSGAVLARRDACPAPRGIAIGDGGAVLVVCEGGEIVELPADPSVATEKVVRARLDKDLRDVVVAPSRIYVSRLRSAEVIELTKDFTVVSRLAPRVPGRRTMQAMRMIAPPPDDLLGEPIMVHEVARDPSLASQVYYGDASGLTTLPGCTPNGPIVVTAVSRPGLDVRTARAPDMAAYPVDVATDGATIAIVAAGNGHTKELPQVYTMANRAPGSGAATIPCFPNARGYEVAGQAVAVAFRGAGAMVVQSREPATIELLPEHVVVTLSDESREDTGHAIFHSNSGIGMACASCHPEGGDDGQVWHLDPTGPVRTTSLRGTLRETAPFHWRGDVPSFGALSERVMTTRMQGPLLVGAQVAALESWLYAVPGPRTDAPSLAAARGKLVFERSDVGCSGCHAGPRFTSPGSHTLRNDGPIQVPSLVGVSVRAPYFHDGCAGALDRLDCGGEVHRLSRRIDANEIADLAAYLGTL